MSFRVLRVHGKTKDAEGLKRHGHGRPITAPTSFRQSPGSWISDTSRDRALFFDHGLTKPIVLPPGAVPRP